jgi:hypothetical protein
VFSNTEQNSVEAMREAATMPQPSKEEGRQAFQRIQELIAAAVDHIPAHSDASATHSHAPKTQGLDRRTNLTDPHAAIPGAANSSRLGSIKCSRDATLSSLIESGSGHDSVLAFKE